MVESMNLRTPIVARLQGTNMEKAAKLVFILPMQDDAANHPVDQRFGSEDLLNRGSAECGREIGTILESCEDG